MVTKRRLKTILTWFISVLRWSLIRALTIANFIKSEIDLILSIFP